MSRLNVANFRHPDGTADNINLDSSGRVGIGTGSPSAPLQLQGSAGEIRIQRPTASQSDWSMKLPSSSGEYQIYDNNNTTARLTIDSSGNLRFNSGYGSVATAFGVRAWINFDGTLATIGTGRASGNMDAVTDNGSGDYTLNFTNDMPGADFAIAGNCVEVGSTGATDNFIGVKRATNYSDSMGAGFVRIATNGGANRDCFVMIVR